MIKINGTDIKTPKRFNVLIVSRQAIDYNAAGATVIDRVATKRTLECAWGALTNAEISAILTATTAVFFNVSYPDPQTGTTSTITCYAGDKSSPMLKYQAGGIVWDGLTMNFIEQ
jgi:hypothetical protein